ncbi:hypothetical protein KFU94_38155 [Chloroflexi bacterium TSY]|nr:hypothetical protein [Chloroflexi bacterium TSY]
MFAKLEGYFFTPQILLYALAYRILGKPCSYKLGSNKIRSLEERTPHEHAFILMFPPIVLGVPGLILCFLWIYTARGTDFGGDLSVYPFIAPLWHQALYVVGMGLVGYATLSTYMVPFIIKLLREGRKQQQAQRSNYQGNRDSQQSSG